MYKKEFLVRWSEIDINLHLTSVAYVKYITDVRMCYFDEHGHGLVELNKQKVGPIVLSEKSYYFKEIKPGEKIIVTLELKGCTDDKSFMILEQRIFNEAGINVFLANTLISFLNTVTRKIIVPPNQIKDIIQKMPKTIDFGIIEKSDLRDSGVSQIDLKIN